MLPQNIFPIYLQFGVAASSLFYTLVEVKKKLKKTIVDKSILGK